MLSMTRLQRTMQNMRVQRFLYYLQTMSETTQRLPDALKKQQSHIDWVGISGFRNRIVHGYLNINSRLVWQVIKNELPELKSAIKALLLVVDDFNDT